MELTRLKELTLVRESATRLQESTKFESDFDGLVENVEESLSDLKLKLGRDGALKALMKKSGAAKLDTVGDDSGETIVSAIAAKTAEFDRQIKKLLEEARGLVMQMDDPVTEAKKNFTQAEEKSKGWYHKSHDKETMTPFGNKVSSKNKAGKHADKNGGSVHFGYMDDKAGKFKNIKQDLAEASDYADSSQFTDEFYDIKKDIAGFKKTVKNPRWMAWLKATDDNFGTDTQTPARAAITAINTLDAQLSDIDAEFDKADA